MCLNTLCILLCTLELSAEGSQIEQICTFKLLGVTINNTLAGLTTSKCGLCQGVPKPQSRLLSFMVSSAVFSSSLPYILYSPSLRL